LNGQRNIIYELLKIYVSERLSQQITELIEPYYPSNKKDGIVSQINLTFKGGISA